MKKSIKRLITIFAVCAVSAVAIFATGCNPAESIKKKIEQGRCKHEYGAVVVIEESTCTEKGKGEKTCAKCEKVETVKLDLADHVAIVVEAVSPTCTKSGKTDSVVCSVCEEVITASQELSLLGHIVAIDKAIEPTCLDSGLTEGEHCSRCNEVLKAQEKVSATGHNLVILEAVEPTCLTEGKTQGVWCDKCETIFTAQEVIPATGEHVDNDENAFCDRCNLNMYDASNAVEVEAVAGEAIAGNWYRIYKVDEIGDPRNYGIKVSVNFAIYYNNSGSGLYISPSGNVEGWDDSYMIKTDDYLDVYIPLGLTVEFDDNVIATVIVTKDSKLSLDSKANVKRLVFSTATEANEIEQVCSTETNETEQASVSVLSLRRVDVVADEWTRNF